MFTNNSTLETQQQASKQSSASQLDNVYYIQQQQIITPSGRRLHSTGQHLDSGRTTYVHAKCAPAIADVVAAASSNHFTSFNLMHNFNETASTSSSLSSLSNTLFVNENARTAPSSLTLQYLNKLCTTDFTQEKFIKLNSGSHHHSQHNHHSAKSKSRFRSKLLSLNKKYFRNTAENTHTRTKNHTNFTVTGVCTTSSETDDNVTSSSTFLKSMSICSDSILEHNNTTTNSNLTIHLYHHLEKKSSLALKRPCIFIFALKTSIKNGLDKPLI